MNAALWFPGYAVAAALLWGIGLALRKAGKTAAGNAVYALGICALAVFLGLLWAHLGRPPMRTLGETRLWYSLLLPGVCALIALRWRIAWPMAYGAAVAAVFLAINLLHPENFDKALMPALQSLWFVPHVVVYLLAYAFLTASALGGARFFIGKREGTLAACDRAVWIGLALLTMGLLFGALWAKEAWGHYWTWDPKETWAFLTWSIYLCYIHIRLKHPQASRFAAAFLLTSAGILLTCWFGVNYLPSAASSVHAYTK